MDPIVEQHEGIFVVRDDLHPGGTKARYLSELCQEHDKIVYASTACGGAQVSLAYAARAAGKKAILFVAKRKKLHPRTLEAKALGALILRRSPGYLNYLQVKARRYCQRTGAHYLELGAPAALEAIADAAAMVDEEFGPFDQIWSAAGSGVLTRGLQAGISEGTFYAVRTGRMVEDVGEAVILNYPLKFQQELKEEAPFPSCPNIDRKAWDLCKKESEGNVLFWNVMGPSPTMVLK